MSNRFRYWWHDQVGSSNDWTMLQQFAASSAWDHQQDEIDRLRAELNHKGLSEQAMAAALSFCVAQDLYRDTLSGAILAILNYAHDTEERVRELEGALSDLLDRDMQNTCTHEETYRGGVIWEICNNCGMKWAYDKGGKPEWVDPPEWTKAENALANSEKEGK